MQYSVFLLAIGFYAVDSVVAGPCKPNRSTSEGTTTVTSAATIESTSAILTTSTVALSDTTTLEVPTTTTTSEDNTTTAPETETSVITSAAESSSTGPVAQPTYVLRASGGGLNNAQPQGNGQPGTFIGFDPVQLSGAVTRTYTLEPSTGRLQDAVSQVYVCAYYGGSASERSPPFIISCYNGATGVDQKQSYLNCKIENGRLSCTARKTFCTEDADDNLTCSTPPGDNVYDTFFTDSRSFWYISSGSPTGVSSISISAEKKT
ncbi:hypothetical protein FHETE_8857 [Fusarium heterosporum]|uniref:Uncharacterized protein n=1 Tax=Fusarium heterosporum TaxID=42747 RepID=A0A8H5WHW7_FUSHE|nr:hypothetical protein FHETE_8857 [Fusarium heterosporum]